MTKSEEIAEILNRTDYFVGASGYRFVGFEELVEVIRIVRKNKGDILEELETLFKYHPDTVSCNKEHMGLTCPSFMDQCDCFLADIEFSECKCMREKRAKRHASKRRSFPGYEEWRKEVFGRDDYTCQKCKDRGVELNAHHVKSFKDYPELRVDMDNGITYCVPCHREVHRG